MWSFFVISGESVAESRDTISVAVVDDSRSMQMIMKNVFSGTPDIVVSGVACSALEAKRLISEQPPDVLTLDVEMPGMSGLVFLEKLMAWHPLPVVMVSGLNRRGIDNTLMALELGAVDFVSKPLNLTERQLFASVLKQKIRLAARSGIRGFGTIKRNFSPNNAVRPLENFTSKTADKPAQRKAPATVQRDCQLVAVGASTGGVTSIGAVLDIFPPDGPPVVIAQHMPQVFTQRLARRLSKVTGLDVAEATNGEVLERGCIRLAPGNKHLKIKKRGLQIVCQLREHISDAEIRPSVDILFQSVAESIGKKSVGVILSGMGKDGAQGLLAMRDTGAATFGESKNSCTVYGMPRAASRLNAVGEELDILELAQRISTFRTRQPGPGTY